ncbi:nitrogen fixation protein NifZ [Pseudacidovorax sp. 1753]|uniref:nitrogen fixation protein NifZ n=1 Tax=Pseudacidovorax sp. 1753 TaxID=3156419 RepID=UPI00339A83F0
MNTLPADVAAFAEPRAPEYGWGLRVVALDDLLNDGSHPELDEGAVLAPQGAVGEIVNIGHSTETNEPIYLVEFGRRVVGCFEEEIAPAPAGLLPEDDGPAEAASTEATPQP